MMWTEGGRVDEAAVHRTEVCGESSEGAEVVESVVGKAYLMGVPYWEATSSTVQREFVSCTRSLAACLLLRRRM